MLDIIVTSQYKKDLKLAKKQGKNINKLEHVIDLLQKEKPLDKKYQNHKLSGRYNFAWECHIESDWLLIYSIDKELTLLSLIRLGSHSKILK